MCTEYRLIFPCTVTCTHSFFFNFSNNKSNTCNSTYFPFFSSSPYIHPSLSSGMSRTMKSPSPKLSNVLLVPAVWGKMVRTRGLFTILLRPVATDTDLARLFSSLWSGCQSKDTTVTALRVQSHANS